MGLADSVFAEIRSAVTIVVLAGGLFLVIGLMYLMGYFGAPSARDAEDYEDRSESPRPTNGVHDER